MKLKERCFRLAVIIFCILITFSACSTPRMQAYYEDKNNYIVATGTIAAISVNKENSSLYIDFSMLTPMFDDTCFKIVGDNFDLVIKNGIETVLRVGDEVQFITAPQYFGDGYVMPIVSVSKGEEVFLEFDEGFLNFLKWLNK